MWMKAAEIVTLAWFSGLLPRVNRPIHVTKMRVFDERIRAPFRWV